MGVSKKFNIFIDSNGGRLGNQIYPLMAGITWYKRNTDLYYPKLYFKDYRRIGTRFLNSLSKNTLDFIYFSKTESEFDEIYNKAQLEGIFQPYDPSVCCPERDKHILLKGFLQTASLIDEKECQKYLYCSSDEIKHKVFLKFGDISDSVCLHVRRTDYLNLGKREIYNVLSKEWIERVINKYYPNRQIICISDDIGWCKKELSGFNNIVFSDSGFDEVTDFWLQTLTCANICSCSTFSLAGASLNPNLNAVIPFPYHCPTSGRPNDILPEWIIKESLI